MPQGWSEVAIGDICDLKNGRAFKPAEWGQTGLPIVRIQNLNKRDAPFNFFAGELDARHHLSGGELLFAWSGTPGTSFGAHIWSGSEAALNQHIFRVDFDPAQFDKRFLKHAINRTIDDLIDIAHGGVGLGHVTKGKFEATRISVAPRSEQQRIADKLDAILARVDACRDRLDRVGPLLQRFRQSVLWSAMSGRLTEDWRALQNATDWTEAPLGEAGTVSGGLTKNAKREAMPMRRPYLRVANVHADRLELDDVAEIGLTEAEFEKTRLCAGDLLIVEGNGSIDQVGRVAMWRDELSACSHQNHLIRWRAGAQVLPKFALYWLMSPMGRAALMERASSSSGLHTLSISKVSGLLLPLPSVDEQAQIVECVDRLFTLAGRLEARRMAGMRAANSMPAATLAKAFRGELVPQDPNDEPAAEMLARLATSTPPKKTAKRGRSTA